MDPTLLRNDDSILLIVDVQGRLAELVSESDKLIANLEILIQAASILEIPVIWNEQVPDKLGATVPRLARLLTGPANVKSCFSCAGSIEFMTQLAHSQRNQVLIAGIETHVCVHQSVQQLLQHDYEVHVIADAVSSRSERNIEIGLQRMSQAGAYLSSVEMALFEIMVDATHPAFRQISKLLKET